MLALIDQHRSGQSDPRGADDRCAVLLGARLTAPEPPLPQLEGLLVPSLKKRGNVFETKPRVALIREGDFFFYVYQLAEYLLEAGYNVEIINTRNAAPEPLYATLINRALSLGARCHFVTTTESSLLERKIISLLSRLKIINKLGVITPFKLRKTRDCVRHIQKLSAVIAFDAPSLYLACRVFPNELANVIYYSLHISDESDTRFKRNRTERAFRRFERSIFHRLRALLIQDPWRADVLLRRVARKKAVRTIFLPVSMKGQRNSSEHPESGPREKQDYDQPYRIVFFGGLWSATLIESLRSVADRLEDKQQLVIRGGRGTIKLNATATSKLIIETRPLAFEEIDEYLATCSIGLALYSRSETNTRHTAFSSEKIARYLQRGLPFIAFRSETYENLRKKFACCELIDAIDEIPGAASRILNYYTSYTRAARFAFNDLYDLNLTGEGLLRELGPEQARLDNSDTGDGVTRAN